MLPVLLVLLLFPTASPARSDVSAEERKAAAAHFQGGDWRKAAEAYRSIAEREPANAAAWHRLGECRYRLAEYPTAIEAFARAADAGQRSDSMYDAACCCALMKDAGKAFEWLDRALAAGFADEKTLLADPDLALLRPDPRFKAVEIGVAANARPCSADPKARQFDFWIGEWDVFDPNGNHAGTNSIQLILGDCVLQENWTGDRGGNGKSLNVYNREKGCWQQTWIDDKGGVIEFVNGVFADGALRFEADTKTPGGATRKRHLSFFDQGKDRVRQLSEASTDGGRTWAVEYDFTYVRKQTGAK